MDDGRKWSGKERGKSSNHTSENSPEPEFRKIAFDGDWFQNSGCSFVETWERPFRHDHRIEYGFAQFRATQRVDSRIRGCINHIPVPLDKNVTYSSSPTVGDITLRRNEIGDLFGPRQISDVIAT